MSGSSMSCMLDSVRDVLVVDIDPLWYSERRHNGVDGIEDVVSGVSGTFET